MSQTRIVNDTQHRASRPSAGLGNSSSSLRPVIPRPAIDTGTHYPGRSSEASSSTSRPLPCHVCGRLGCTLISHRDYVFPVRTKRPRVRRPESHKATMPFTHMGALHPARLLEIRIGKLDPFIQLPIREKARDDDLFQHFFKISTSRMVTATGKNATQNILTRKILPLALEHPAVCQGAIAYAAAQLANIQGHIVPDSQNLTIYNKSLQLLYQAMKERPEQFKDVLIFPAIAIAGFDLTYGRVGELRRHLDSIYKIVKSVGGLQNLGLGGIGAHLLLWIDFFGSILLNRRPMYDLPSRPDITLPGPPHVYGKAFEDMWEQQAMDERVLAACLQTCRLTELLEKIVKDPGPTGHVEYFTYKRNLTDHQFSVANADHLAKLTPVSCVCRAAITLELWILHNVGDTHAIFHHLGIELQKALMATDLASFWNSDLDMLQWILFSAGSVMTPRNGSRWYQQLARQTLFQQYGDTWPVNWMDLQKHNVRRFIWSDKFLTIPFEAFCHSITSLIQEG